MSDFKITVNPETIAQGIHIAAMFVRGTREFRARRDSEEPKSSEPEKPTIDIDAQPMYGNPPPRSRRERRSRVDRLEKRVAEIETRLETIITLLKELR